MEHSLHDAMAAVGIPSPPAKAKPMSNGFLRWGMNNRYWLKQVDGVALFGDFSTGESHQWFENADKTHDAEQIAARRAKMLALRKEMDEEQRQQREQTAIRALNYWNGLPESGTSPYLEKKQVDGFGVRFDEDALLIPLRDADGKLWSLQTIKPDGSKRFVYGGKKKGCFHSIGEREAQIIITEGYSTGASINMATGLPVVIAFDAGNLEPVIDALKAKHPTLEIIIAGDEDCWGKQNAGREKALAAAQKYGCKIVFPIFNDFSGKPTDFNDLHCLEGLDAVKAQLLTSKAPEITAYSDWDQEQAEEPHASQFELLMKRAEKLEKDEEKSTFAIIKEAATLPTLQKRTLYNVIKKRTGYNLDALRKATAEVNGMDAPDHLMLAIRAIDDTGRENLLSTVAHVWQWSQSGVWRMIDEREVKYLILRSLERHGQKVTRSQVDSVADVLKTDILTKDHEWNTQSDAINFLNGELHWTGDEWELREHCRENYRTTQVPHHYDADAICHRFEKFLYEIFIKDKDSKEKRLLVLELIGYTLVSHARFEVFVLLIGGGANGKSVLLDVIRMLVGAADVSAVQPSQFNNRFQRGHLHGKLANLVTEIAEGAEIADAELKAIVSGELITAEHKNKNPFDFPPFCTCWFGTNHMPHTRDYSDALFRRAKVITFNRKFKYQTDTDPNPEDKADPHLKDKLALEMSGIINLSLQAFGEVIRRGAFTEPQSCADAKLEWRIEADQVAQYVGDMCIMEADAKTQSAALYDDYKKWADAAGVKHKLGRKSFTSRLVRSGANTLKGTGGTRIIGGIRLKTISEEFDEQQ